MKSAILQGADGVQAVPVAELSSVEGGGRISFYLGAVGSSIGTGVGNVVESVVNAVT